MKRKGKKKVKSFRISFCGMFMKQYVKGNISMSAQTSVKYFTKMLAQSSETVIMKKKEI